ncbi:MAG: DUF362 domain-containing protein, partial [Verrucomicrobia bacterium]|nr:DUF362 domain-containing protein [Verrucomicrobiota bacterium]
MSTPSHVTLCQGCTDYSHPADIQEMVSRALQILRLPEHFIRKGDHVVIKPNWVKEHDERHPGPDCWEHVVTHPAVIEAVTEWAASQLDGSGKITICDAPQTDSSFAKIREYCRLDDITAKLQSKYPGVQIALLDLRPEEWHAVDGITVSKT